MSIFSQNVIASKKTAPIYVHPVNIHLADNTSANMIDLQIKLTEVIHESIQVYLSVSSLHHKEIVEHIRENKTADFFSCGDLECLTPYIINFDLNSILIHKIQCEQNANNKQQI